MTAALVSLVSCIAVESKLQFTHNQKEAKIIATHRTEKVYVLAHLVKIRRAIKETSQTIPHRKRTRPKENWRRPELIIEKGQCSEENSFGAKTTAMQKTHHVSFSVHTLGNQIGLPWICQKNPLVLRDKRNSIEGNHKPNEWKTLRCAPKKLTNVVLEKKMPRLEQKVQCLKENLREAAAVRLVFFSVVCMNMEVFLQIRSNAPARRSLGFIFMPDKENSVLKET
nr:uncharacterized protein LOC109149986 [Ipomoea batatas]